MKITGRIAALTLAVLLLLTALVGCAPKQAAPTLPFDENTFLMSKEEMQTHGLEQSELKKIAEIFSAAFGAKNAFNAREALVAANRGKLYFGTVYGVMTGCFLSLISQSLLPLWWREAPAFVCLRFVRAITVSPFSLQSRAISITTPFLPEFEMITITSPLFIL